MGTELWKTPRALDLQSRQALEAGVQQGSVVNIAYHDTITGSDLRDFFGLTGPSWAFVHSRRGEANRLGLAVQLGCLRFLGFVPKLDSVPGEVIEFVAHQLDVAPSLGDYSHVEQIQHFARVVRGDASPVISGEGALRSLALVDAVQLAAVSGERVAIDDVLADL